MDSFEFESGAVLEDVVVEYVTRGNPKYDEQGNIKNAIVFCPTLKGGLSIFDQHSEPVDYQDILNDFFFIKIISLGAPDSCSPSTTGLRYDFPPYTVKDRVNFKRQFLKERFGMDNVLGLIGEGLGGSEVYTWACDYPNDMEFIVNLNSSFKTCGYGHVFARCVEAILESSEDMYSEVYSTSLSQMSVSVYRLLFAGYFPKVILESSSADEIDVMMDDYVDEALFLDVHDINLRNKCILDYDVENKLSKIKAESLILGTRGMALFNPITDGVLPVDGLIENCTVKIFDSTKEDHENGNYTELFDELASFLKKFRK